MTRFLPYEATFLADLSAIYEKLHPATVGCFNLSTVSFIPIATFVRGGSHLWFVEQRAGRIEGLLSEDIAREQSGRSACLACDATLSGDDFCAAYVARTTKTGPSCGHLSAVPGDPARCAQFVPGRKLRVIHGDGGRGRGAGFATRVEAVVAGASTPTNAVEAAIDACQRSATMNIPLPIEDGALDLMISVLAPSRLMEHPYAYFEELMTRRFGAWTTHAREKLVRKLDALRGALFQTQLDAHVRELARLAHPRRGRLYFATMSTEVGPNGSWTLERGITACFEALASHFVFDFDTFPAEAFLRRVSDDRSVVLQASLLRPKPRDGGAP